MRLLTEDELKKEVAEFIVDQYSSEKSIEEIIQVILCAVTILYIIRYGNERASHDFGTISHAVLQKGDQEELKYFEAIVESLSKKGKLH